MAWKEHSQLSAADKRYEDVRQKMIVCQSCLDRVVTIFTASNPNVEFPLDPSTEEFLKKLGNTFVDWVYEKANEQKSSLSEPTVKSKEFKALAEEENPVIPTPNVLQKKVLDIIQQKTGLSSEELYPMVLEWSLTIDGVSNPVYPKNDSSIKLFLTWLGEKKR